MNSTTTDSAHTHTQTHMNRANIRERSKQKFEQKRIKLDEFMDSILGVDCVFVGGGDVTLLLLRRIIGKKT